MADESYWTRPISDLPFMKREWWTTTTPRDGTEAKVSDPLQGSFITGPGEALGRIAVQQSANVPAPAQLSAEQAALLGEQIAKQGRVSQMLPLPSAEEASALGAQTALTGGVAQQAPRQVAAPAQPVRQYAPQRAMQAATARDLGLPPALRPRGGMDYGVDYDARVDAALAAGEITPEKAAAAKAQYAKFRETPLGLQFESMRAEPQLVQDIGRLKLEQMSTEERLSERAAEAQAKVDAQLADSERIYAEQRKATEAELVSKQREMDAIRADIAATKIDPQNYFSSAPAWAKVLSILSVGIGGFASGWSGGRIPNTALAQLNAAIDRDIEAQKANLAKKRGEFGAAQGVYAQVRQKLGDDEQAYNFTRALLLNQGARAAQALAGEGRTAQIRNGAAQLSEKLRFDAEQANRQVLSLTLQQQAAERQRQAAAAFAASPAGRAAAAATDEARLRKERMKELKDVVAERKLEAEYAKLGREIEGVGSEEMKDYATVNFQGQSYIVPKEEARELRAMASSAEATRGQVDEAVAAGTREGYYTVKGTLGGEESKLRAATKPLLGTLAASYAKVLAGGFNPSGPVEERANEQIGEPPRFGTTEAWQASLRRIPVESERMVRERLEAVGAVPVDVKRVGVAGRRYEMPTNAPSMQPIRTYGSPE
jgi:hypothetical protein